MPGSEIAQLKERIETEQMAATRGLSGLAMVAHHRFITQKMENTWDQFQALADCIGTAEAHRLAFGEPLPGSEVQ